MKLSIVIVNYNGKQFLENCISSVVKYVPSSHELIIVDNGSTDSSVEDIKKKYPDVILIESSENLGFSRGNNIGVSYAVGDFVLLLNNDTILLSHLTQALSFLEEDDDIALIGIKMLGRENEYRLSCGYFPTAWRLFKFSSLYKKNGVFRNGYFPTKNRKYYEVDWVEGSCMLIRREMWEVVGGMDEDYFMYVEDIDLCRRLRDKGYKIVMYPYLSYMHYGGYCESRLDMLITGFMKYHKNHSGYLYRYVVSGVLLSGMLARMVVSAFLGLLGKREHIKKSGIYMSAIKKILE